MSGPLAGTSLDAAAATAPDPTPSSVRPDAARPSVRRGARTLFVGLGLLMIGNGLNGAVIGVRSASEGFGLTVSGIVMAGYFAGFLLSPSIIVPRIPTVGHIRVFAGLASTASSVVLVHSVSSDPVVWTLMRAVFGFCMAGLYVVVESWLSEMTTVRNRGRVMAVYMIVSMGGLGVGQSLIAIADPASFRLFVLSSVLVSMSLVPVTLAATTRAPTVRVPEPVSLRELVGWVPTGVIGSFASGSATGIVLGLGAVYSTAIGLSPGRTAFFLVAPTIGAIACQWPIGRLSDRVSRRSVILGVALVAASISATLMFVPEQSPIVPAMMIGLGGTLYPLYSLVVTYTLDWTPEGRSVGASGTLVRVNGAGALVGPLVTAPLMTAFGPTWFFWALTIAFTTIACYVTYRMLVKEAMPIDRQREFVPYPARAGALAIGLVVRPVRTAGRIASGTATTGARIAARKVTSRRHVRDVSRHPSSRPATGGAPGAPDAAGAQDDAGAPDGAG